MGGYRTEPGSGLSPATTLGLPIGREELHDHNSGGAGNNPSQVRGGITWKLEVEEHHVGQRVLIATDLRVTFPGAIERNC